MYKDEAREKLVSFLNTSDNSNITKLLEVIMTELDNIKVQKEQQEINLDIDFAFDNGLDKIGENIRLERKELNDSQYRVQLKFKQAAYNASGTISNIIVILQSQLNITNIEDIKIEEIDTAHIRIEVPLDNAFILQNYLLYKELVEKIKVAGVKADTHVTGTFNFDKIGINGFSNIPQTVGGTLGGLV